MRERQASGSSRDAPGAWLTYFGLATLATALVVLGNDEGALPETLIAIGLLLVGQLAYWLFARPSKTGIRSNSTRAWVYTAIALVTFAAACVFNPWAQVALAYLMPQLFILFSFSSAAVWVVVFSTSSVVARAAAGEIGTVSQLIQMLGGAVFITVFSLFIGGRIASIASESAERLALITALHDREDEVAAIAAARGAEAERTRIARDMHDTLAQGFASIVTLGHAVQGELDADPATARRHVELITATAQDNLAESRQIIRALSSVGDGGATLAETVRRTADRFAEETGVEISVDLEDGTAAVSPAAQVVAIRLVQEGLANIRKHAEAHRVRVALAYPPEGGLELRIEDDGRGFDRASRSRGFGLPGMRSRVEEAGGRFELDTAPGAGTRIHVHLQTGPSA